MQKFPSQIILHFSNSIRSDLFQMHLTHFIEHFWSLTFIFTSFDY